MIMLDVLYSMSMRIQWKEMVLRQIMCLISVKIKISININIRGAIMKSSSKEMEIIKTKTLETATMMKAIKTITTYETRYC